MSSKNQSEYVEPYYQVPKIVAEFDKMTNDHQNIFMHLYEKLRQKRQPDINNQELAVLSRVGLTQLKHKLNDLEKWGFLKRKGMGHNRQFFLGEKFNNRPESDPDTKPNNRPEQDPVLAGIDTSTGRPAGYLSTNSFNKSLTTNTASNSSSNFSKEEKIASLWEDYPDGSSCSKEQFVSEVLMEFSTEKQKRYTFAQNLAWLKKILSSTGWISENKQQEETEHQRMKRWDEERRANGLID